MGKTVDLGDLNTSETMSEDVDIGDSIVKNMLETLSVIKVQNPKRLELRSSGLPYCEIRKFLFQPQPENYSKDFYTSTGTAIHEALQEWIPRGEYKSYIFGNWCCTGCNKKLLMQTKPKRVCSECVDPSELPPRHLGKKHYWKYEEIDFKYKKLSGHIDLVLRISRNPDRYIVIDFKTTDMLKKRDSKFWDPKQPSSKSYILQIRTYCTMLQKLFGLNIVGWHIISINRAAPIANSKDYHALSGEWSSRYTEKFLNFIERDIRGYKNLQRLLKSIEEENVQKSEDALNKMAAERPCTDLKSYKSWMAKGFFGKEQCEMLDSCCMSTRRVAARIRQELEKDTDG
jgi:hypothetical protein